MKKQYNPAELEITEFIVADIVTASEPGSIPDDGIPESGFKPGGWI